MNKQVMNIQELPNRTELTLEQDSFVYFHGAWSCFCATFKNATSILTALKKEYEGESWDEHKEKIMELANKTVIAYAFNEPKHIVEKKVNNHELVSDIFVEGDDNICFNSECFI